jgi:hypothetical protein
MMTIDLIDLMDAEEIEWCRAHPLPKQYIGWSAPLSWPAVGQ